MHTIMQVNDGSTYEKAESIALLDISDKVEAGYQEAAIIAAIKMRYNSNWCNCEHDCCGHWKSEVGIVAVDMVARRAVIYIYHSQNV